MFSEINEEIDLLKNKCYFWKRYKRKMDMEKNQLEVLEGKKITEKKLIVW